MAAEVTHLARHGKARCQHIWVQLPQIASGLLKTVPFSTASRIEFAISVRKSACGGYMISKDKDLRAMIWQKTTHYSSQNNCFQTHPHW
jgi:hypothetical protein